MKLKATIFSILICLLYLPCSVKAQEDWCGTSGGQGNLEDFDWKIETTTTDIIYVFHPRGATVGGSLVLLNTRVSGAGTGWQGYAPLTKEGSGDFSITVPKTNFGYSNGTVLEFYFTYNGNFPGERNTMDNPSNYTVGESCGDGTPNIAPTVSLTSPSNGAEFETPNTITITADATDVDGTISKVEFYSNGSKVGEKESAPFTFVWSPQPGTYSLKAKAIDNKNKSTDSAPVSITVTGESTIAYCGTSGGQGNLEDFDWKIETTTTDIIYVFHPRGATVGGSLVLLNTRVSGAGTGWQGYAPLTKEGSGDFSITVPKTNFGYSNGTVLEFYFTYNGNFPGERNTMDNPSTYTIGSDCTGTLPVNLIDFNSKTQPDGTVSLNWATASESNNNYFLLERSADGINFNELTKIYSKNVNSTYRLDYQFTDENPVSGNNYYKLSQFDKDGKSKELGLRVERGLLITQSSSIYPNPLKADAFNVVLNQQITEQVSVSVSSISGQEIYKNILQASSGNLKVELPFKPANGIYIVKIGEKQTFKLLVE